MSNSATRRGLSPVYHQTKIPRLVRDAVRDRTISPAWQIPIMLRHYQAAGVDRPKSMFTDMVYPYIIGALVTLPDYTIVNDSGFATADLHTMVPAMPTNFNPIVRDMRKAGLVDTVLAPGGRRTISITATETGVALLDGWLPHEPAPEDIWLGNYRPAADPAPARLTLAPPPPAHTMHPHPSNNMMGGYDTDALSRLCLRLGIERDEWANKFFQAEANLDNLIKRMSDQEVELQELRRRLDATPTVFSTGKDDKSVRARLSDDELAALDRLMREVPTG